MKLKPCPFCGGTNLRFTNGTHVARHANSVLCKDCGAKNGFYLLRENAIKQWNRRPTERKRVRTGHQQLKAEIAALATRLDPLFGQDGATSKELTNIAEKLRQLSAV